MDNYKYLKVFYNDILAVAKNIGLKEKNAKDIALDIQKKCKKLFV